MKNIFLKKTSLTFAVLLVFAVGCSKDFLDRPKKGELSYDTFFQTADHAVWSVNAIYQQFREWDCIAFPWIGATDIMSDDANKGSAPNDALYMLELDEFSLNSAHTVPAQLWKGYFQAIGRANLAIENIPKIDMDAALKARLIGEARTLRAYSYLLLVQWFGDLPIITRQLSETEFFTQTRQPKTAVFDLIESDLLAAAEVLPQKLAQDPGDLGRVTRGTAHGLLAKMYMVKHDFPKAEATLQILIDEGQYSLAQKYTELFTPAQENGPESIFEIPTVATPAPIAGPGASPFNMIQGVRGVPNLGWGFNAPSLDFVNSFETGDPRRRATVLAPGEQLPDGSAIVQNNPDILDTEERYNKKAWVPAHSGLQDNGPGNIRIMRYADALLLMAEAKNENGKGAEALPFLNQVRKRARGTNNFILPDVTVTDQTELREKIYRERRSELGMEQNRWFDLLRWGRAAQVMTPLKPGFTAGKNELLPIPQTERDLAPGLSQNPMF